ncbi:MAG: hypothetical protein IPK29_14035 [Betaproteobacteria bacterium]|nr:hypothetical protein [Betaproteobacteria bacterium]
MHVDDVARVAAECLCEEHRALNLATGRSNSFRQVAELVAHQFAGRVEIAVTPRANPITHRHYDITNLIKAFPGLRLVALEKGLSDVHNQDGMVN